MITLFRNLYLLFLDISQSHVLALILLSGFTSALMTILNWLFKALPRREAQVQSILAPQIQQIREQYNGIQAQHEISKLYHRYRYHPILALRSALPLFFQLPFLYAAYHALSGLSELQGVSFWIIPNLGQADAMILGYNILPFVMTGINLLTAWLNPEFKLKDRLQAVLIALFFLVLLYQAPAALLIYWSMNNLIFLIRTLWQRTAMKDRPHREDPLNEQLKKVIPEYALAVLIPFLVMILLTNALEFLADGEGKYIYRFSKTVPLMIAAALLYFRLIQTDDYAHSRTWKILGCVPVLAILLLHFSGLYPISTNRYVVFAYLSAVYLVLILFLVCVQIFRAKREPIATHKMGRSSLLLYCAALLIPSMHLASVNPMYLSGWFYPLFLVLPFAIFGLAWVSLGLAMWFWPSTGRAFHRFRPSYSLAFAMLFTFLPVIRAMMQKNSAHDGDFWLILLSIFSLIYFWGKRQNPIEQDTEVSITRGSPVFGVIRPNTILLLLVVVFFVMGMAKLTKSIIGGDSPNKRTLQQIPPALQNLELREAPNIYLFVYDGMPNPRVFREQSLPLEPMQELFDKYGFKVYEDTYTLGNESLNSMAMTLNISADKYASQSKMQDIYSGNSVSNLVLRALGYTSHNLLENYFTGTYAMVNADLITEYFPPKELSDVQSDFFLTLLRGVLQGEFRFDTKGIMAADRYTEADRQNRKHELIRDGKTPKFVVDQVSKPSHSQNSGKCLPNETELWIERYRQSLEYLERDLEALHEYDPNAIAIIIGDHGPSLLGDCYVLQNYKREDITAELIWDRIGTMIAVHWPDPEKAAKYDQKLTLNQDLFAVIFAYMADDPTPLKLLPDRTFSGYGLLTRPAVRFKQGIVLK